jgi:hypothetical protein
MDSIAEQALAALNSLVTGMIPPAVPNGLNRQVRVLPQKISPTGLGAYVGLHPEPQAGLFGRRVQATVQVLLSGGNDADAMSHLGQVTNTLLAQDRADLRSKGIFQLQNTAQEPRSAQFQLLYEYIKLPSSSEGDIRELDLQLGLNDTPYRARLVWEIATSSMAGNPLSMNEFQVADDPDVNANSPASAWVFNAVAQRIEQTAAVRGGPLNTTQPRKAGAQLLWRPAGQALALERLALNMVFESASEDGIGLVFNRVDDQNFCYFLASQRHQYHLFGRKKAGVYSLIGAPNVAAGFELNRQHELDIVVYDGQLRASLNGRQTLAVDAGENLPAGEVGFLTHGNNGARFYRARAIRLIQP